MIQQPQERVIPVVNLDSPKGEQDMPSREERAMILRMVEEGKISAEEGARLLAALGEDRPGPASRSAAPAAGVSTILRIRVSDLITGHQKVSVNVPIGLARLALRYIPTTAGVDVDEILHAIDAGMKGRIVDVIADEDNTRVEIFYE